MKPAAFELHRPESVEEAAAILAQHGDEAKVLAGGQSLVALMNLRLAAPERLVDITRIGELRRVVTDGDGIEVGAGVRQAEAEDHPGLSGAVPLFGAALAHVAHREIRNAGTVCGSLAHGDGAAELPAVSLVLDAEMTATSVRGTRRLPASDFFVSYLTTALAPDELLTSVRFMPDGPGTGTAFGEIAPRQGDYALAGAAARITIADGRIARAAIGFLAVASTPVRAESAEALLTGEAPSAPLLAEAAHLAAETLDPPTDVHAGGAYRRHVAAVLARRVLGEAVRRAEGER